MQKSIQFMGRSLFVVSFAFLLTGCAAVLLGGVAVGVSIVHDRRITTTVLEDEKIEFFATAAIRDDKTLSPNTHTTCVSYNGTVLITGQVDNALDQKRLAELVGNVRGVRKVVNETTIGPPASFAELTDDVYITSRIKFTLLELDLPDFDPTLVKVVTEQGTVYLMGLLTEKEAEAVAEKVRYVPHVVRIVKIFEIVDSPSGSSAVNHDGQLNDKPKKQ